MAEDEIIEAIRVLPNLLPPASPEAISQAEEAIGHPLPPLLRRLYPEIANGGFGPRGGILGVAGSEYEHHFEVADILDVDQSTRDDWPGMLWLFDWSAGIWSVMDSRDPAGPMWIWNPMGPYRRPDQISSEEEKSVDHPELLAQNMTIAEWLTEWLKGSFAKDFKPSGLRAVAAHRGGLYRPFVLG
ncbi:SMI1/KNR4 family protein [Streptosporangium sp. NPDC023825]|uniref:SMI1/KNR4 family protein n=1 Tax=Streptosporangium sp. NPDC023825 TaxID=3154909 RepID=UPI003444C785